MAQDDYGFWESPIFAIQISIFFNIFLFLVSLDFGKVTVMKSNLPEGGESTGTIFGSKDTGNTSSFGALANDPKTTLAGFSKPKEADGKPSGLFGTSETFAGFGVKPEAKTGGLFGSLKDTGLSIFSP